jgi:hypothetical protein
MQGSFDKLFSEIALLHTKTQNCATFGESALKSATKLQREDTWIFGVTTEKVAGTGTKGVAVYALANFIFECAKHGKQLIPL